MSLLVQFPLIRKNGVDQPIPPSAFVGLLLAQVTFELHAQLLQHMRRTAVVSNTICPNAMYPKTTKPKIHDGMRGFGSVSTIPILWVQLIADVRLHRVHFIHAHAAVSNQEI